MAQITKRGKELHLGLWPLGEFPPDQNVYETLQVCSLIARHATTLHRLYEISCSVEMSERRAEWHEKYEARVEARIAALVQQLGEGFETHFNGDPRGFPVKIKNPAQRYNTWGGAEDGWGV